MKIQFNLAITILLRLNITNYFLTVEPIRLLPHADRLIFRQIIQSPKINAANIIVSGIIFLTLI